MGLPKDVPRQAHLALQTVLTIDLGGGSVNGRA